MFPGGTHRYRCMEARSLSQVVGPFGGDTGTVAMGRLTDGCLLCAPTRLERAVLSSRNEGAVRARHRGPGAGDE